MNPNATLIVGHRVVLDPAPRALVILPFEGEAHGERFRCLRARCARGKCALTLEKITPDGFKGAGARLAEALNGRWTGRDRGYLLAPSRAALWRALFVAGWDAGMDWRGSYGVSEAPKLEAPDGRTMTLKEAAAEIAAA
jgi:hypothetical protein